MYTPADMHHNTITPYFMIPSQKLGRKRLRQEVRFTEEISVSSSPKPSHPLSPDDIQRMWYQHAEFAGFKLEACNYISGVSDEGNETRGFEKYTAEGCKNKQLARECILTAIRQGFNDEDVALIAQKCGEWSQEQAVMFALKDFYEVYCHSNLNEKRAMECPEDGRRVRARARF